SHDDTREVFARQQHFSPYGRQQIVEQALLQHLTAEEIHEDANAAKKHRQPQEEELKDGSENEAVAPPVASSSALQHDVGVHAKQRGGRERQQVDPQPAAGKKILLDLEPQNRRDLATPQGPGTAVHMAPPSG